MLLMGLEAGVRIAGEVHPMIGNLAGTIASTTRGASRFVAASPLLAGRAVARRTNKRFDLTGKAAGALRRVPGLAGNQTLLAAQVAVRKEKEKEAGERTEAYKNMTYKELGREGRAYLPPGSSSVEREARAKALSMATTDEMRQKETASRSAEYFQQMKGDKRYKGMDENELKRMASARAMNDVAKESGDALKLAKDHYSKLGKKEEVANIDKMIEKNPHLETDAAKRDALLTKIRNNPDMLKNLSAEAISDTSTLLAMLPPGALLKNADDVVTKIDQAQIDSFKERNKDNKNLVGNLDAVLTHVRNSPNTTMEDIKKTMVQRNAQNGRVELYNKTSGGRQVSDKDLAVQSAFEKAIVNDDNFGRDPKNPEQFKPKAQEAFHDAVKQFGLKEAVTKSTRSGKMLSNTKAVEKELGRYGDQAQKAFGAANAPEMNKQLVDFSKIMGDIESEGVTSEMQVEIGAQFGGVAPSVVAKDLSDNWDALNAANKAAFAKMVKILAARERDILKKEKAGANLTKSETTVKNLVSRLREEFPEREIKDASGLVIKGAGPSSLTKPLHGTGAE
jgi:hypothetical protein